MSEPRFRTLGQLCAAMRDNQLDPDSFVLVIDNDHIGAYLHEDRDSYADPEKLLSLRPADLLTQALDQLGIPHEPA